MQVRTGLELTLGRYKVLYREAAEAPCMYILLEGEVEHTTQSGDTVAVRRQARRQKCDAGGHEVLVGLETLTDALRLTTATTLAPTRLLQLSGQRVAEFLGVDVVKREFVRDQLPKIPLFKDIHPRTLNAVLPLIDCIEGVNEDVIIREGVVPDMFCILVHGSVEVVLKNGHCVARLDTHAAESYNSYPFFGEIGLLNDKPADANVYACTGFKMLTVTRSNFGRFLNLLPAFEQRVKARQIPPRPPRPRPRPLRPTGFPSLWGRYARSHVSSQRPTPHLSPSSARLRRQLQKCEPGKMN